VPWEHLKQFIRDHPSRILGLSRDRKRHLSAIRPLESSLYRLEIFPFSAGQKAEYDFNIPFDHLNRLFFNFTQFEFRVVQEAENEFAVPCNQLKRRFLELKQTSFCADQEAENEFGVPGNDLKHRFLDHTQVAL